MKKYLIPIFILFLFYQKIFSQNINFFPMQIGNEYQYLSSSNRYFYWEMDRDTIYSNENRYFSFPGWLDIGDCRIDSNGNLLSISRPFFFGGDPEEYLLFKANAELNGVWPIAWNYNTIIDTGYGMCIFDDTLYVFDKPRRVKGTLIFDESYYYFFFWLAEEIGIIRTQYDDGSTLVLNYAKINGIIYGQLVSVWEENSPLPADFSMSQNYPNPFNGFSTIKYSLPKLSYIRISVFNILGKEVETIVNEEKPAGSYTVNFDGGSLPSGVYIYRLTAGNYSAAKKLILLK